MTTTVMELLCLTYGVQSNPVTTMQIAPTILTVLGVNPMALKAVKAEGTKVLPATGLTQQEGLSKMRHAMTLGAF